MEIPLRGFGGEEVYKLIVGSEKEVLSVQKDILLQIPYFQTALSSGQFTESRDRTFRFPDESPRALADLLYFVYVGKVDDVEAGSSKKTIKEECSLPHIRAWIIADKYKAEDTANKFIDSIVHYHMVKAKVSPRALSILSTADHHDSSLYKALLHDLAYVMKTGDFASEDRAMVSALGKLSHADLLRLVKAITIDTKVLSSAFDDICSFHKHEITEKCKSLDKK